ncbi:hypothetical protein DSO57_1019659 [Entomophthora muscae]|uniref:Uncharacterized protein n=1 Tax=Entomophthora muscae TaxID=34485 RepID=A0ACC2UPU1_9FUNG|nr:hypothetical protein DSO57_1019659 [Entomophthora muscae]
MLAMVLGYFSRSASAVLAAGNHILHSGEFYPWHYRLLGIGKPVYPITGEVDPEYKQVKDVFKQHFDEGREVGASVCVYSNGAKVSELYGGYSNYEKAEFYSKETLQVVFSVSKVIEAIAIARLVEKGLLKYESTIASIWPEFGAGGKENVTLADLMRHEAGVGYLKDPMPTMDDIMDRDRLARILASQEHLHGGKNVRSYHAVTRGWILNEVVRRVDPQERTLGQIYQDEFNTIPGVEFHLGLSPENEVRRAKWEGYPAADMLLLMCVPALAGKRGENNFPMVAMKAGSPLRCLMKMMSSMGKDFENSAAFSKFEAPSSNGFTNASSLAKLGAILAAGGTLGEDKLMSRAALDYALGEEITAFDNCICVESTMTRGGFGVFKLEEVAMDTKFYGWPGMGGSILVFNLDYKFSFSYVMNAQHISILVGCRARRLLVAAFTAHVASS